MKPLTEHKEGTTGVITWIANTLSSIYNYNMFQKDMNVTVISNNTNGVIVRANGKIFALNKEAASLIGIKQIS